MNVLNYDVDKRDDIVILGAGPSLLSNIDSIKKFIKKRKPIVIGTTYNFSIATNYTMIVGKSVFASRIKRIKTKKIIVTPWVIKNNKSLIKHDSKHAYWKIMTTCKNASDAYWEKGIRFNGLMFGHHLSNCGFTALLASHFFHPKEVMIAGFDGPESDGFTMRHFNGITRTQKSLHKDKEISRKKGVFLGKIIQFMNSRNVGIISFKNDQLWGLNTNCLCVKKI